MGHYGQVMRYRWVEAEGAEGPQPAKRACLPQGLEEGARSAPQLLVNTNNNAMFQSAARPNFISPRSQLVITSSIISVQFSAEVIWCLVHYPGKKNNLPSA